MVAWVASCGGLGGKLWWPGWQVVVAWVASCGGLGGKLWWPGWQKKLNFQMFFGALSEQLVIVP